MRELFERWAELEPERCRFIPGSYDSELELEYPEQHEVLIDGDWVPTDYGADQVATQQAIEARDGWPWNASTTISGEYEASVTVLIEGKQGVWKASKSHTSPAEALLSAYLSALEAVKTQEVA